MYEVLFIRKEQDAGNDPYFIITKDFPDNYYYVHSGPFTEERAYEICDALNAQANAQASRRDQ